MEEALVFPPSWGLRIEHVELGADLVSLTVASTASSACCPVCGQNSFRRHSSYLRTLQDLPAHGRRIVLRVHTPRFFCDHPACARRTFAEPLPELTCRHARKTLRLLKTLQSIGWALGGQAGARLGAEVAMPCSPSRLLHYLRQAPLPTGPPPQVVGVDDWAWRKGQRYGTIICDLERHCPIDLLPERSAESWADWLHIHPGITVISRDRGDCYVQGTQTGAPTAVQVADRFHLLTNLRQALERLAQHYGDEVRTAWRATADPPPFPALPSPAESPVLPTLLEPPPAAPPSSPVSKDPKRTRRLERYEQVHALHREGVGYRTIAARLGLGKNTVRRFLRAGSFPERAKAPSHHRVAPWGAYLQQRWQEGRHNAAVLWGELQKQGFDGSYDMVRRWLRPWRAATAVGTPGPKPRQIVETPSERLISAHQVGWLLLQPPAKREPRQERFVQQLSVQCPVVGQAATLATEFQRLVHKRQVEALEGWLAQAGCADAPAELRGFAQGLQQDQDAVRAALSLSWSNGQVEGQINRLKLLKRQMYGQADFELLRQRVLHTG